MSLKKTFLVSSVTGKQSALVNTLAGVFTKGPRLRTRAFVPFVFALVWFAAQGPLNYWGIALALAGEALRLWASAHLDKGAPHLTTSGPYAYCRNPLYLGSMLLGLGFMLAARAYVLIPIAALAFLLLYSITIAHEENRLKERYPESYIEYCRNVPALFPRFAPWSNGDSSFAVFRIRSNREHTRALWTVTFAVIMVITSQLAPLAK